VSGRPDGERQSGKGASGALGINSRVKPLAPNSGRVSANRSDGATGSKTLSGVAAPTGAAQHRRCSSSDGGTRCTCEQGSPTKSWRYD